MEGVAIVSINYKIYFRKEVRNEESFRILGFENLEGLFHAETNEDFEKVTGAWGRYTTNPSSFNNQGIQVKRLPHDSGMSTIYPSWISDIKLA